MAIKFALSEIHHSLNGENLVQAPGGVFEVDDADVDFLTSVGAVREPEERELLSYKHSIGQLIEAPAPTPAPAAVPAKGAKAADGSDDNIG